MESSLTLKQRALYIAQMAWKSIWEYKSGRSSQIEVLKQIIKIVECWMINLKTSFYWTNCEFLIEFNPLKLNAILIDWNHCIRSIHYICIRFVLWFGLHSCYSFHLVIVVESFDFWAVLVLFVGIGCCIMLYLIRLVCFYSYSFLFVLITRFFFFLMRIYFDFHDSTCFAILLNACLYRLG